MEASTPERVTIELTREEAKLVIGALRQFEPYWPSDADELARGNLLAGIRVAIEQAIMTLNAVR